MAEVKIQVTQKIASQEVPADPGAGQAATTAAPELKVYAWDRIRALTEPLPAELQEKIEAGQAAAKAEAITRAEAKRARRGKR